MKTESRQFELEAPAFLDAVIFPGDRREFWQRQFQQTPTRKQKLFDWSYGVFIPLVCVAADFIVFAENGLLETYRTFAHVLSATSILAMAAWLLWGQRLGWLCAPLGGFFVAGSGISFLVGVILFPYSFIGLFFIIGVLGFTPLLSGLVFLRNGMRALNTSSAFLEPRIVWQSAILAAMFGLVIPYLLNIYTATAPSVYTSVLMQ